MFNKLKGWWITIFNKIHSVIHFTCPERRIETFTKELSSQYLQLCGDYGVTPDYTIEQALQFQHDYQFSDDLSDDVIFHNGKKIFFLDGDVYELDPDDLRVMEDHLC